MKIDDEQERGRPSPVEEAISARTEIDVRAPRKGGRENNTQVPVLLDQRQGMYTAVKATEL